jgi:hypothetical protein
MKEKYMKNTVKIIALTCLLFSVASLASDDKKYRHFPAVASPNIEVALCNIANYNKVLTQITQQKEMSVEDMVKIHELSYTLENALGKLSSELTNAAVNLEQVHLASETLQQAVIQKHAEIYLDITAVFSAERDCLHRSMP